MVKYKINITECDIHGYKPFYYEVFVKRPVEYQRLVECGYIEADSRDDALKEINRRLDTHRKVIGLLSGNKPPQKNKLMTFGGYAHIYSNHIAVLHNVDTVVKFLPPMEFHWLTDKDAAWLK